MDKRFFHSGLICAFALIVMIQVVKADGIIIPEACLTGANCIPIEPTIKPCDPRLPCLPIVPPRPLAQFVIRYHHVTVKIIDQIATTHVDQVFQNPNSWAIEGTYMFPIPEGAVIRQFVLWVDGKPVEGKVMDANEARKIYESTIRRNNDPALLEYIGLGAFQAKIFPIPPKGERRIELEYTQYLTADKNLVRYSYPLNTEKFSRIALASVAVTVEIASPTAIRAVYSPSHRLATNRQDERHVTVSYEAKNIKPDSDFLLYFSLGESEAFHLFSYRDPSDPLDADGFFMALLAPKPSEQEIHVAKDVILVLDQSGSMEGEKYRQAQAALAYILSHLHSDDRFGLVTFSSSVQMYANSLQPASKSADAVEWVNRQSARGSTDIQRALLESVSLAGKERPTYLLFLTDGLPTVGVTKSQAILENFSAVAPKNVRVFPFGVGNDVDTFLLDSLSQQNHGLSTYVNPAEKVDEILSAFYEKISTPVLTAIELDFGKVVTYDIYPYPLPDLFAGSQIVIVGRYRQGGTTDITLKGDFNGMTQTLRFLGQSFVSDNRSLTSGDSVIPRLWATRKIGYLLSKIRLQGADKETIAQIVKISIRYGIVTPYTSYLVTEPAPLGADNQERMVQEAYRQMQTQPTQSVSGQGAVQKAADQGQLQQAQQAPSVQDGNYQMVIVVGARTFVSNNGVWMDTAYDPKKMTTIKVAFLSDDYFRLAQSRQDIAAAFAIAKHVIVVIDGRAYEVSGSNTGTDPIELPVTLTPKPRETVLTATPSNLKTDVLDDLTGTWQGEISPWVWLVLGGMGLGFGIFMVKKLSGFISDR